MRTRSTIGLVALATMALLVPAGVAAQTDTLLADNPRVDCDAPLPASMVTGELGNTVVVIQDAELDKVTLAADAGGEVVDAEFDNDNQQATIVTTTDTSAYIAWSCAPINGEPVLMNDDDEV